MSVSKNSIALMCIFFVVPLICKAEFMDHFDDKTIDGWFWFTGDGNATMDFVQKEGFARIFVDATRDSHNVWWAIIKQDVTPSLDIEKLKHPDYELRVQAKVRVSHAPRRINFMVNTQRTTNFHKQLREYDIPDTSGWHVISMTTRDFDAVPGDTVYVQLGVTDWGRSKYHVDLDYYQAEVVNANTVGSDKGEPLLYHPPIPPTDSLTHHLAVAHDAVISSEFPDVNFNDWSIHEQGDSVRVLTVSANQWAILRWDFGPYAETKVTGAGILELTTYSVASGGNYIDTYGEEFGMEFGKIRVTEILGGDPDWNQQTVTYNSLIRGKDPYRVLNSQMIYDLDIAEEPGSENHITIPGPVMQRLLDGSTRGLLLRPLGALDASVYASEAGENYAPKLHFTTE